MCKRREDDRARALTFLIVDSERSKSFWASSGDDTADGMGVLARSKKGSGFFLRLDGVFGWELVGCAEGAMSVEILRIQREPCSRITTDAAS